MIRSFAIASRILRSREIRTSLYSIGLVCWSVAAVAAERDTVTIVLKPEAVVAGDVVRLSDIADIDADLSLRVSLGQTPLGAAPAVGVRRAIRRDDIERSLKRLDDRHAYVMSGAAQPIVHRATTTQSAVGLIEV